MPTYGWLLAAALPSRLPRSPKSESNLSVAHCESGSHSETLASARNAITSGSLPAPLFPHHGRGMRLTSPATMNQLATLMWRILIEYYHYCRMNSRQECQYYNKSPSEQLPVLCSYTMIIWLPCICLVSWINWHYSGSAWPLVSGASQISPMPMT